MSKAKRCKVPKGCSIDDHLHTDSKPRAIQDRQAIGYVAYRLWPETPPDRLSAALQPRPAKPKGLDIAVQALGIFGEPVGIRTRDLLIKSQLLYRLSYRPTARLGT